MVNEIVKYHRARYKKTPQLQLGLFYLCVLGSSTLSNFSIAIIQYKIKNLPCLDNKQVVDDLYNGLYRKRQLGYGGLFNTIKIQSKSSYN